MALTTQDRLDMQDLVARNAWALDTGDTEAFVATFAADAVLDLAARHEGQAALRKFAEDFRMGDPWLPGSQHVTNQMIIEGDGERATIRSYVQRIHRLPGRGRNNCSVVWAGYFNDVCVKTGGKWLFKERVGRAWEGKAVERIASVRARRG